MRNIATLMAATALTRGALMSQTTTESGNTPAATESGAQKTAAEVEGIVNALMPGAAAFGPAGVAAAAGVSVAEGVANAILGATADHQAPLVIATGAVNALASNAAPVIAALPAADQAKATASLNLLQVGLADLKALLGGIESLF